MIADDDEKWLAAATSAVKQNAFYMQRAIDSNNLKDALKFSAQMFGELRTSKLSPHKYYELYIRASDELRSLEMFFRDETARGCSIAELYELVQHAGNILPRLYLLCTIGSVYIKSKDVAAKDILKDLVEMCRAVQHPLRGLFLRSYLAQVTRDKLPSIGSELEGDTETHMDALEFVLQNFTEMNKLWVRMQHQGPTREKEKREKERNELRDLVGKNLHILGQLEGVDLVVYRDTVLPRILEQVVNCKDELAQCYLMDCIIQVFPDDFHLQTLDVLLGACPQLQPSVDIKTVLSGLMERLSNYAASSVEALPNFLQVDAFSKLNHAIGKVVEAQVDLPASASVTLYLFLLKFTLHVHSDRLDYVDQVLGSCVSQLSATGKLCDDKASKQIVAFLSAPLEKFNDVVTILKLTNDPRVMEYLDHDTNKAMAIIIIQSILKNDTRIATADEVDALFELIKGLIKDFDGLTDNDEIDEEDFQEEQNSVARLVHFLYNDDPEEMSKIIFRIRKHILTGGPKRLPLTIPPLVLSALKLIRRMRGGDENPFGDDTSTPQKILQLLTEMDSTSSLDRETRSKEDEADFPSPDSSREKRKQSSAGSSQPSKVKRILPTRSDVWEHYTRTKEDRDRCLCNYCQKNFSCLTSSGTTNLRKHLEICKNHQAWLAVQKNKQENVSEDGKLKVGKLTETVFREATNEMVVMGQLPLAFVDSPAWKHFCKKAKIGYTPHSRRTLTKDIVKSYVEKKDALKRWFLCNKQRVSITTDIWVSQTTGASYMVITVHYIDPFWRLKKLIIGFKHVTDHKGQTIASVLLDCLAEWGIERVFCVTVDNATANTSALRKFHSAFSLVSDQSLVLDGEFLHMRCSAHIINLIVRDGMAEIDQNVTAIRNAISYVRSHTNRLSSFELKVETGKISRGSLPLDVKTSWNSTYLMLTTAQKFKVAFNKMVAEDKLYNDYFCEIEAGAKRIGPPDHSDWNAVDKLCRFLVIFYNSTLVVSASTSLNSHKCYEEVVTIATNLMALVNSYDPELKSKATEMLKKFDKYWDGLKNLNKMLMVATVFDPSKKLELVKLCFEELYGNDTVEYKEMYDSLLNVLRSLFKEYSTRLGGDTDPDDQSSQPNKTSQSSREKSIERMEIVDDCAGYKRIDVRYKQKLNEIGVREKRDELETYLRESVENPELMAGMEYDVLSYWRSNAARFPVLSEIARDVLAMQVSSVASESAFSTSGRMLSPHRICLTHFMIEVLMCSEQWMKQDLKMESRLPSNAQILEELEEDDKLERENGDASTVLE